MTDLVMDEPLACVTGLWDPSDGATSWELIVTTLLVAVPWLAAPAVYLVYEPMCRLQAILGGQLP